MPKTVTVIDFSVAKILVSTFEQKKLSEELGKSALSQRSKEQLAKAIEKGKNEHDETRQGVTETTAGVLFDVLRAIGWDPVSQKAFLFDSKGQPWVPKPKESHPFEYLNSGIRIPGIWILQSYVDEPVDVDMIKCSFSEAEIPERWEGPKSWSEETRIAYIKHYKTKREQVEQDRELGKPGRYHNDMLAALELWYGAREQPDGRSRIRPLELRLRRSWFYLFDFVQTCLQATRDGRVLKGNPIHSLPIQRDTESCSLPALYPDIPFRIGVGTVVLSCDNKVVVPLRSRSPTQGRAHAFAVSAGEGMLADDSTKGFPWIGTTSVRALQDELGLRCEEEIDYCRNDLKVLGFMLDWEIGEPFFAVLVKTKRRFKEIHELWRSARDRWEHKDVLGVPWNRRNAMMLLRGQLRFKGKTYPVASKREQANFGMALRAEFPDLRREEH